MAYKIPLLAFIAVSHLSVRQELPVPQVNKVGSPMNIPGFIPFIFKSIIVDFKIIYKKHHPFGQLEAITCTHNRNREFLQRRRDIN